MTEELLQNLTEIEDAAAVVEVAKEQALKPAVRALVSTMEERGYDLFNLIDSLATYIYDTHPERKEVVKCLESCATCIRRIENQGSVVEP